MQFWLQAAVHQSARKFAEMFDTDQDWSMKRWGKHWTELLSRCNRWCFRMCNFVRQKAQVLLHPNVDEGRADQYRRVHSDGAICHGGKLAGERGDTTGKGFKQATIKKCALFQPTTNESLIPAQMDISTAKSPSTIFWCFFAARRGSIWFRRQFFAIRKYGGSVPAVCTLDSSPQDKSFEVLHAVRYHNVHEGKSITRTVRVQFARHVDHTSNQQKTLRSQHLQRIRMNLMTEIYKSRIIWSDLWLSSDAHA